MNIFSFVVNEFVKSFKSICIITELLLFSIIVYFISVLFLPEMEQCPYDWKDILMETAERVTLDNYESTGEKDSSFYLFCKNIVDKNDWMKFLEMMCDDEGLSSSERKIYEYCVLKHVEPSATSPEYLLLVKLTESEENGDNVDLLTYLLENCPNKYNANQSKELLFIIMLTVPVLLFFSYTVDLLSCDFRNRGSLILKRAPTQHKTIKKAKFITLSVYNVLLFLFAFVVILAALSFSFKAIFGSYFTFKIFNTYLTVRFIALLGISILALFLIKTVADYVCCTFFEIRIANHG